MTPEAQRQRDIDGCHAAITATAAYHHGDMNTVRAVMEMHRGDGVPLLLGLLAMLDSLLRSVPGEPDEILAILRNVALQAEAGDVR